MDFFNNNLINNYSKRTEIAGKVRILPEKSEIHKISQEIIGKYGCFKKYIFYYFDVLLL